ncbi:MFS transporter [Cellulomonas sp. SG140]|uniref:MFS transporter n=1 Tax=Cellulomonas sp. SG140 TaxID=2976536 RepID=UPI0021E89A20|nr:MFS transporter [Cellulomonas sp. SG140]
MSLSTTGTAGIRRWWALGGVTLAVLAVSMDVTILSVALPTLAGALSASASDLQWFSAGYALVLAALMLPAGWLGDRVGRKRVLLGSLLLFAVGSAACAGADSPAWFIGARLVLGVGGAGVIVMAMSALMVLFDDDERPRAVAVWGAANLVAFPVGPILGGWLLSHAWWGWVFLLNVPVTVLGMLAVAAWVPESSAGRPPRLDGVGIVASSAGLTVLTWGFIQIGQDGWRSVPAWALMAGGLLVLVAFGVWEVRLSRRGRQPLVDPALFRSRLFTWGVTLFAVLTLALIGLIFALPQYFQAVLGTDPEGSGLRLLPLVGGLLVGLAPSRVLATRLGIKLTVAAGFVVLGAGLALGATTTPVSGTGFAALWTAISGVGTGMVMATVAAAALAEISADRAGVGSAVLQAVKGVGAPLGAAVLGSVLAAGYRSRLDLTSLPAPAADAVRANVFAGLKVAHTLHDAALGQQVRAAFVHGVTGTLLASLAVAVAGALLALVFLPGRVVPAVAPEADDDAGHAAAAVPGAGRGAARQPR